MIHAPSCFHAVGLPKNERKPGPSCTSEFVVTYCVHAPTCIHTPTHSHPHMHTQMHTHAHMHTYTHRDPWALSRY